MLNDFVNFIFTSSKHHFELIITRELENGTKANQASILHQPRTTGWGSHFSIYLFVINIYLFINTCKGKLVLFIKQTLNVYLRFFIAL